MPKDVQRIIIMIHLYVYTYIYIYASSTIHIHIFMDKSKYIQTFRSKGFWCECNFIDFLVQINGEMFPHYRYTKKKMKKIHAMEIRSTEKWILIINEHYSLIHVTNIHDGTCIAHYRRMTAHRQCREIYFCSSMQTIKFSIKLRYCLITLFKWTTSILW